SMKLLCSLTILLCWSLTTLQAAEPNKPLLRSVKGGLWSDKAVWEGGKVPSTGDRVLIRPGHTVRYDVVSDDVIRSIHIGGVLSFAADKNTRLNVGLIKIQPGENTSEEGFDCEAHVPELKPDQARPALEVGTPTQPIAAKFTATIRLVLLDGMD